MNLFKSTTFRANFPILDRISDEVFNPPLPNPRCTIASRKGVYSLTAHIRSEKIPMLFENLNTPVPNALTEMLAHTKGLFIDLESIESNRIRFYVYPYDYDKTYFETNYVFDEAHGYDPETHHQINLIGFFIDSTTGLVDEYKYYWWNKDDILTYNYRYNVDGSLKETFQDNGRFHPELESMPEFFPLLQSIDDLVGLGMCHIARVDRDQTYVTINEFEGYPGKFVDQGSDSSLSLG